MFEQLSATIGKLDIPVDHAALIQSFTLLDRLTAKIHEAVTAFDEAECWRDDGATSMTSWLRTFTRRSGRDAARCAKTAHRLASLPVTSAAYRDGTLSGGQVQAIVANLNDKTTGLFADAEADLIPVLADMQVKDVSTAMQAWAQAAKDSLDEPEPGLPDRSLHLSRTLDGRRELSGSLDPEAGELAEVALRLATTRDSEAEPKRSPARRRADAFVDILRFFLDHQDDNDGGRNRPHLNVLTDYDDIIGTNPGTSGRFFDGTSIDPVTLRRLACDANIHRVIMQGKSSVLDYGGKTRLIPANLWAALVARDLHCRMYGCDLPPQRCEAHHVTPWEQDGETSITNTVLGCTPHHHIFHLPGWHTKLQPDGTFEITTPDGRHFVTYPPGRQQPNLWTPPPP